MAQQLQTCLKHQPQEGIQVFISLWRERLRRSQFAAGCPIVAAAIEAPEESEGEPIRAAVAQVFQQW